MPKRSATGHALLAGDPHLDLTLPSIWYEVHLVVPGRLDAYGVTIPGLPAVVIGFNRDVAWTFTNTGADVMDFYVEEVDDDRHPTRHRVDGTWRPIEPRVEVYRGPKGETVAVDTVYYTFRGPMQRVRDRWVSLRWSVLDAGREAVGFIEGARARTAAEFEDAMARSYRAPAQNMLAADRGGHIAIRSTGRWGHAVICVAAIGVEGAATFSFDVCDARLLHSTRSGDAAILFSQTGSKPQSCREH